MVDMGKKAKNIIVAKNLLISELQQEIEKMRSETSKQQEMT